MKIEIKNKIDEIKEALSFASYDINPAGSRTEFMMDRIQKIVSDDIKDILVMVNELELLLKISEREAYIARLKIMIEYPENEFEHINTLKAVLERVSKMSDLEFNNYRINF